MLIPNKTKTSNSFSIVASFDDKGAGSPPGGGTTFVPVVSLEYSLPGPIAGGPRLPPQPQASPSQSLTPRRARLPRHRAQRHVRNTIAVPPVEIPETAHQIQGIGIHRQERVRLEYWMEPAISPMIRLKSLQSEGYVIRYRSSSTPTVPFSGPDLLCGNGEGAGRGPHPAAHGAGSDELEAGDVGAWDQRGGDKQKLKELDLHGNKRPTSRNSTNRKIPSFDKVSSEREELRPIGNSLPPAKQSPLRSNGVKNNLLRADQFISSRSNVTTGREDDLVAMGTLWSPSQLQTRGSCTTISSSKSTSAPNSGSYTAYGTLPARRPINLSTTSTSTRQLLHHSTALSTQITPNMGNGIRKEVEPKYGDPLSGAPPSFQSRLMELAALEAETARWERTKKVKKKPKADRDS